MDAPPVRRAPALPVTAIQRLEEITTTSPDTRDRITAGAILFGIFSCARASDLARAINLHIDFAANPRDTTWINSGVENAKTAIGGRRRLHLPLLAPVVAFKRPCQGWLQAREALGLPIQGPISPGQLIPAFHHSGMPAEAPLTSRQITTFLKLLQCPDIPPAVTSHSVKTTCLTWAAMAGVPLDQRRLLGHHVHDAAKSTETYSREVLYPAARSLEEVLLAIRDGSFKPDEPTTRRFAGPSDTLGLTTSASTASQSTLSLAALTSHLRPFYAAGRDPTGTGPQPKSA